MQPQEPNIFLSNNFIEIALNARKRMNGNEQTVITNSAIEFSVMWSLMWNPIFQFRNRNSVVNSTRKTYFSLASARNHPYRRDINYQVLARKYCHLRITCNAAHSIIRVWTWNWLWQMKTVQMFVNVSDIQFKNIKNSKAYVPEVYNWKLKRQYFFNRILVNNKRPIQIGSPLRRPKK